MPLRALVCISVAAIFLAALSALFSAIETAFFSLRQEHIERLKARRADFAAALAKLMENPRRLLSAILLGDALVNLPLIILSLFLLRKIEGPKLPFWAAALLIFAFIVIFCDLLPKLAALGNPYRFTRLGVRLLRPIIPAIDPVARLLQRLSEGVAEAVTPKSLQPAHFLSEDELETLLELGTEMGALDEGEEEIIHEIIKLGEKTAKDCMTPRVDAFALPDDLTSGELILKLRAKRYRRVPIYGETPDHILGILEVRPYLLDPSAPYPERLIPPSFVPETMKALDLLHSFLRHPQGLAIVVDEHGGTEGIVTLADIVEELISDAVPQAERGLYIESISGGGLIVSGGARLDDINELLSVKLKPEGIDTISGLIFNLLGALPKPGAQLKLQGLTLTVRRVSKKRIEEVLIVQDPALTAPEDGEDTP
jgi:putative hemolysin